MKMEFNAFVQKNEYLTAHKVPFFQYSEVLPN